MVSIKRKSWAFPLIPIVLFLPIMNKFLDSLKQFMMLFVFVLLFLNTNADNYIIGGFKMPVYLIVRFYVFSTLRVKTTMDRVFANVQNLPHYQYEAIREIKIERI